MMLITFRGLRSFSRGWQIDCLTILWIIWQERNIRIFEDRWRMEEMLWNLLHFYSSLWASCTIAFRGVPVNVIQLC